MKKEVTETTKKTAGYKAGTFAAMTLTACVCALLVGITIKILLWML